MAGLPGDLNQDEIQFPTDRLTILDLRSRFPEDFRYSWAPKSVSQMAFVNRLLPAIELERELALRAFCETVGKRDYPRNREPRHELVDLLASDYRQLGLSTGEKMSAELIRDFERQATAQAGRMK